MKEHLYIKKSLPAHLFIRFNKYNENYYNNEYFECNNCQLSLLIKYSNYKKIYTKHFIYNNYIINSIYYIDNISLGNFEYSCEEFMIKNIIE